DCPRKMDQVKLVIQLQQGFRGSEKKIAAKIEVAEEVVDNLRLGGAVEIDQHVAAENQIHALHKKHLGSVLQVQAAEVDELSYLRADFQLVTFYGLTILPLE